MKRVKKIQQLHAQVINKLTKHVRSLKKDPAYTMHERYEIAKKHGHNYRPLVAGQMIRNMTISQRARIFRLILKNEESQHLPEYLLRLRLHGNVFTVKKIFCESTLGPLNATLESKKKVTDMIKEIQHLREKENP